MNFATSLPVPTGAGSLESYIQLVKRFSVLSQEEEFSLATRYRKDNDLDAARQLVMSHLRVVVSVARGSSETWQQLPNTISLESTADVNHVRLMIGEQTLLGAMVMGEQKLSLPLQEIISSKVDITPVRHLLQPGAPLGQIVMDFWSNIRG